MCTHAALRGSWDPCLIEQSFRTEIADSNKRFQYDAPMILVLQDRGYSTAAESPVQPNSHIGLPCLLVLRSRLGLRGYNRDLKANSALSEQVATPQLYPSLEFSLLCDWTVRCSRK